MQHVAAKLTVPDVELSGSKYFSYFSMKTYTMVLRCLLMFLMNMVPIIYVFMEKSEKISLSIFFGLRRER